MQIHEQRAEGRNLERLIDRMQFAGTIGDLERASIRSLWRTAQHHRANTSLSPDNCGRLITSGWAGWLRYGEGGRRQIFLFLIPGDFIVPSLFQPECCDLICLTPLRTVDAQPLVDCGSVSRTSAEIAECGRYYRLLLVDHLTRLTAGCTTRGVAHMLVELHARSLRSGACADGRFDLPIGQRVLASALGRSTVQVNKILQQFQAQGLVTVGYDWIQVHDTDKLQSIAGITHSILQPSRPAASLATLNEAPNQLAYSCAV